MFLVDVLSDEVPVNVHLEAFNPCIPLNSKDSAIPVIIFNYTVRNPNPSPVEVRVLHNFHTAISRLTTTMLYNISAKNHAVYSWVSFRRQIISWGFSSELSHIDGNELKCMCWPCVW